MVGALDYVASILRRSKERANLGDQAPRFLGQGEGRCDRASRAREIESERPADRRVLVYQPRSPRMRRDCGAWPAAQKLGQPEAAGPVWDSDSDIHHALLCTAPGRGWESVDTLGVGDGGETFSACRLHPLTAQPWRRRAVVGFCPRAPVFSC